MSARRVTTRRMTVVSICSHCGQEVAETAKGNAYRHGFNRYKKSIMVTGRSFSQEDGKACEGSGQPVTYKPKTLKRTLQRRP